MKTSKSAGIEWPTVIVAVLCYTGILIAIVFAGMLGFTAAGVLLGFSLALHSSLTHEVLHGHPFRQQWLSDLLVFPAVGLFLAYERFRDTHLQHHRDSNLTDPHDDPESNYLVPVPHPLRLEYRSTKQTADDIS